MSPERAVAVSRLLSYVLRHHPEQFGLRLSSDGWVAVARLLAALECEGQPVTRGELEEVVRTSDKQRFKLDASGERIRASQGHSIAVDLGYAVAIPPARLYHGTTERFLESIRREGLVAGERHHVHLSASVDVATQVGRRRGRAVVLRVRADAMAAAGFEFYRSDNGVWLTEGVPVEHLEFPPSSG